jgi:hypothetical protein
MHIKNGPCFGGDHFCSAFTCRRHGGGNRPEASAADDGLPEEKALEKAACEITLISHFYPPNTAKSCVRNGTAFCRFFWKERYVPLREKALTFKAAFFIIFA